VALVPMNNSGAAFKGRIYRPAALKPAVPKRPTFEGQ
jgi:hypothetical protein